MTSNYSQFMKEREGANTIESEEGFITYKFDGSYCMVINIFVAPEFRHTKVGTKMAKEVEEICKDRDRVERILCSVDLDALNYKDSAKFILSNKYVPINMDDKTMYFVKEL